MSVSVKINNVTYSAVPSIQVPKSTTGTATFWSCDDATGTAAQALAGAVFYNSNGRVEGTATVPSVSQDGSTKILTIS